MRRRCAVNNRPDISALVFKLLRQRQIPIWTLANELLIYGIANEQPIRWGPRGRRLRNLFVVADALGSSRALVLLSAGVTATKLWWKVKRRIVKGATQAPACRVLVGFGANAEEQIWLRYRSEGGAPAIRMNSVTLDGMSVLGCPAWHSVMAQVLRAARGYVRALARGIPEISKNRVDLLTHTGMRLGQYAFHRTFWEMRAVQEVGEVAFLALDTPPFACADAGRTTRLLQHGLLARTIVPPSFDRIDALTPEEASYLRQLLPSSDVRVVLKPTPWGGERLRTMLIVSIDTAPFRVETARAIIAWGQRQGISAVIRLKPGSGRDTVNHWCEQFPGVLVEASDEAFETSLARQPPMFVVSWHSTALAEALMRGCLPVSVSDPESDPHILTMVYPLQRHALFWPRDADRMAAAAGSTLTYRAIVDELRAA